MLPVLYSSKIFTYESDRLSYINLLCVLPYDTSYQLHSFNPTILSYRSLCIIYVERRLMWIFLCENRIRVI